MMYRVAWIDEYGKHQWCLFFRQENAIALLNYFYEQSQVYQYKFETV